MVQIVWYCKKCDGRIDNPERELVPDGGKLYCPHCMSFEGLEPYYQE